MSLTEVASRPRTLVCKLPWEVQLQSPLPLACYPIYLLTPLLTGTRDITRTLPWYYRCYWYSMAWWNYTCISITVSVVIPVSYYHYYYSNRAYLSESNIFMVTPIEILIQFQHYLFDGGYDNGFRVYISHGRTFLTGLAFLWLLSHQ